MWCPSSAFCLKEALAVHEGVPVSLVSGDLTLSSVNTSGTLALYTFSQRVLVLTQVILSSVS